MIGTSKEAKIHTIAKTCCIADNSPAILYFLIEFLKNHQYFFKFKFICNERLFLLNDS